MELIREGDYFTCDIGEVDYKCYVDLHIGWYIGAMITVVIKKYSEKKFWKFKYKALDFEYKSTFPLSPMSKFNVKGINYFCPEYVRALVDTTLYNRESDIREQLKKEEFKNNVKVITKI